MNEETIEIRLEEARAELREAVKAQQAVNAWYNAASRALYDLHMSVLGTDRDRMTRFGEDKAAVLREFGED